MKEKRFSLQNFFVSITIILILFIGSFFRLYRIRESMTFLGDEGRDALVVKRMIVDKKFTLLGPITSVGSMYMGPVYYYFMAPFLYIFRFDPVGPAIMVAIFSIATIALLFRVGKDFFSNTVGLISAFFYAISPLPIMYGRASWNPNVVPFFALLLMYSLLKVTVKRKYLWLILVGFSLGILLQLHYVTFMFLLIMPVCFLVLRIRPPVKYLLFGLLAWIVAYSPFLLFEFRHQFVNTQSAIRFLLQQKSETSAPIVFSMWNTAQDVTVRLFWRLIVVVNAEVTKLFIVLLGIVIGGYLYSRAQKDHEIKALKIIIIWLFTGILSYTLYRGVIYDYYFGSLFPVPYLLVGILVWILWRKHSWGKIFSTILIILLTLFNFAKNPQRIIPNNQIGNTEAIARFVYEKIGDKQYNFALIANKNSDHAYRYFLELWGKSPVVIENDANDPKRSTVTDQLLIICEEKVCKPLGHPLWEIAGFGMAEIVDEWNVATVRVFKLVHLK